MNILIALIAIIIEKFFAYPKILQNYFRHPIEWIGAYINFFETRFNQGTKPNRLLAGFLMLITIILICLLIALALNYIFNMLYLPFIFKGLIAFALLASRQLGQAVELVTKALAISLDEGREALSHIVGRDVKNLDEAEISRGAIETLAENSSDGFIAPLFYLLLFGLPGIIIYKAINTADSMVGHKNKRYKDFGFFSAKLDDIVNYIPARITAFLFIISAAILKKANWREATISALRDAHKHASPNAGWPEASLAGALNFSLGGKRFYNDQELDLPQMGNGKRDLGVNDIKLALKLYNIMLLLVYFLIFIAAIIFLMLQY